MIQAVLVGGSGLVGMQVAARLAAQPDVAVVALVRRQGAVCDQLPADWRGRVREVLFPFGDDTAYARLGTELACDVLFCCVGTTMRQAGSKAAFLAVDLEIPRALIARLKELDRRPVFALVSSTGAARPFGFYLSTKAKVERLLLASGLRHVIVRPSLLLGERAEQRLGERLAALALPGAFRALAALGLGGQGSLAALRPIEARDVAQALVNSGLALLAQPSAKATSVVLEGRALQQAGRG